MQDAAYYRVMNLVWAALTLGFIAVTSIALGYVARFVGRLRGATQGERRQLFIGFAFAGPWIVGFIIFVLGPALVSFYYSFTNYQLGGHPQWIGLENYQNLLNSGTTQGRQFMQALFNSFYYALIGMPLQILAALGMALLLNRELPFMRVFRTIFYLPVILAGGPAVLLAWRYMLASNGGFINVALQKFADSFFVFGFLYRLFIYLMETFNGFWIGLTRGDPIGPFKYVLPGLIAVLFLLILVRGEWTDGKRVTAWRVAQILGIIVLFGVAVRSLLAESVDISWTLFVGAASAGGLIFMAGQPTYKNNLWLVRSLQLGVLTLLTLGLISTLSEGGLTGDSAGYVAALLAAGVPVLLTLVGEWTPRKKQIISVLVALLCAVILARAVWLNIDRAGLIAKYLTFQTALDEPGNLDYLRKVYPEATLSSLWIYGAVAAVFIGVALLGSRYPRARRWLTMTALLVAILFTFGAIVDGVRYFKAYDTIGAETGKPTYHFTLFRQSASTFPEQSRVPLWMTNELWTKPSLVMITMWSSGAGMLIFLAALKSVPKTLYEAAQVDGASKVQQFFRITLPMISPAMFYNIVIGIIAALQTFDTIYIIQTTQTQDSLRSAAYFLYIRTFNQLQIGEGAAVSWILVAIILTITALQFRYSRSWVYYEA